MIAEIEPQSAYAAFVFGFRSKLTYFMRTIPDLNNLLVPIEEIIRFRFIPALTGGHHCSDLERELLSLPVRFGGLGITNFVNVSSLEYDNSRKITKSLSDSIIKQKLKYNENMDDLHKIKNDIKHNKQERFKTILEPLRIDMNEQQKRINNINQEKGVSNWLTILPLVEHGFDFNKQQFWDCIRLRYGWNITNLPTTCACGAKFDIQHCMSCKKGGFINVRHNHVRDLTAKMLADVCKDVSTEPALIPLTGETMKYRTAKTGSESRLDVRVLGFWIYGQQAFLDVRVFHPNASRYVNLSLQQCYKRNEDEKKRHYNERILQVENGSFTPLVFSIYGGMARKCQMFYSRLADLLAEKKKISKSIISSWIRTKLCYALQKSLLLCLRGSRSLNRNISNFEHDIEVAHAISMSK